MDGEKSKVAPKQLAAKGTLKTEYAENDIISMDTLYNIASEELETLWDRVTTLKKKLDPSLYPVPETETSNPLPQIEGYDELSSRGKELANIIATVRAVNDYIKSLERGIHE